MRYVVGRMSNTATAQSCNREGRTKSKGLKEPLTQQAKGSEDNLKGWQTNHQKRILNNPTITYGSIQSGNSRRTGITQATNLQTQEVQGVSKEKGSRLSNIASTIWVRPRIVCHRDCNRDSDAQIKYKDMSQQERPRRETSTMPGGLHSLRTS